MPNLRSAKLSYLVISVILIFDLANFKIIINFLPKNNIQIDRITQYKVSNINQNGQYQ